MRKTDPRAKLLNLPEEQQAQLAEWLLSGMPYHQAKEQVKSVFGVDTSMASLSGFWQEVCSHALLARRQRAVSTAKDIADEAAKKPGTFDEATIDAIKQKAFELSISPQANPDDVKSLFTLVLKSQKQSLEEKQLSLAREKFEFDASKAALAAVAELKAISADSALNQDEKIEAVRKRLFGIAA